MGNPFPAKRDVRGRRVESRMLRVGHCIHGHPVKADDHSVYWDRDGRPQCRVCVNARMQARALAKARAAGVKPRKPAKPAKLGLRKTVCSAPEIEVRMHQLIGEIEREPLRYRRDELNAEFVRLREQRDEINRNGFDRGE